VTALRTAELLGSRTLGVQPHTCVEIIVFSSLHVNYVVIAIKAIQPQPGVEAPIPVYPKWPHLSTLTVSRSYGILGRR